ncbi:tetratricopeptide repeat protein [Candidatus Odyssella thessalonicensis]|uniref:tetratricopeptide repeat protein n=1 Tax=Candidatus Odyssella thessalonicensis TaxID=84647 RepID=UPI001584F4E0|nr:sel1 repeat family protein [Candidatus Odyssella thessalonicensis]
MKILSYVPVADLATTSQIDEGFREVSKYLLNRISYEDIFEGLWVCPLEYSHLIPFMLTSYQAWTQEDINNLFKHIARNITVPEHLKKKLPYHFIRFSRTQDINYWLTLGVLYEEVRDYHNAIELLRTVYEERESSPDLDSHRMLVKLMKYIQLYGNPSLQSDYSGPKYKQANQLARANIMLSARYGNFNPASEKYYNGVLRKGAYRTWDIAEARSYLKELNEAGYEAAFMPYLLKGNASAATLRPMARSEDIKAQYYYGFYGLEDVIYAPEVECQMYLSSAALHGHTKAQAILGVYHWKKRHPTLAEDYLLRASRKGNLRAYYNLGCIYLKLASCPLNTEQTGKIAKAYQRSEDALKIFKRLADQDFIPSYNGLLSFYCNYLWLDTKPAQRKYTQALYIQAEILYKTNRKEESIPLLLQACERGYPKAYLYLSQIYAGKHQFNQAFAQFEILFSLNREQKLTPSLHKFLREYSAKKMEIYAFYSTYLIQTGLIDEGINFFRKQLLVTKKQSSINPQLIVTDEIKELRQHLKKFKSFKRSKGSFLFHTYNPRENFLLSLSNP